MSVTRPSTCGMITAASRDFSVATYSVVSFTGISFAVCTLTGIPAGPGGAAPRTESPLQAAVNAASAKTAASRVPVEREGRECAFGVSRCMFGGFRASESSFRLAPRPVLPPNQPKVIYARSASLGPKFGGRIEVVKEKEKEEIRAARSSPTQRL